MTTKPIENFNLQILRRNLDNLWSFLRVKKSFLLLMRKLVQKRNNEPFFKISLQAIAAIGLRDVIIFIRVVQLARRFLPKR